MKLRVEDAQPRDDTLFVRVSLNDDSGVIATEDFVFAHDRSPEQCAWEIQKRFDDRQDAHKGVGKLQAVFPVGKEFPVVTGAAARNVLGV